MYQDSILFSLDWILRGCFSCWLGIFSCLLSLLFLKRKCFPFVTHLFVEVKLSKKVIYFKKSGSSGAWMWIKYAGSIKNRTYKRRLSDSISVSQMGGCSPQEGHSMMCPAGSQTLHRANRIFFPWSPWSSWEMYILPVCEILEWNVTTFSVVDTFLFIYAIGPSGARMAFAQSRAHNCPLLESPCCMEGAWKFIGEWRRQRNNSGRLCGPSSHCILESSMVFPTPGLAQ